MQLVVGKVGINNLEVALSKDIDSIDVGKMSNGGSVLALNAVATTTTSAEIAVGAAGFKHVAVELTGSAFTTGNFAVAITGCSVSGGTFGTINKQKDDASFAPIVIPSISTNATFIYIIPNVAVNYIKITGTRTTDGTLTVRVTPFN